MPTCPVCGFESPDEATECGRCHLAIGLFASVREAAGDPDSDPGYLRAVSELLVAVETETTPPAEEGEAGALSAAGRFLPLRAAAPAPTAPAASGAVGLPSLPPAGDVPVLLRQVNDYLQIGRRQGVDLSAFTERAREVLTSRDRDALEFLARELFVHLAASLTEEYELAVGRRNELSALVGTSSPDVELESARAALALGDLAGAQRRLRHIEQTLSDLEDQWATVQILVAECDLMTATIRELGGDPEPALGPLGEGRRLAREGDRSSAERVLARAAVALWSLLAPGFVREVGRIKEALLKERAAGGDVTGWVRQLRQLAADLRHRNFAAAIAEYRQLRPLADGGTEGEPPAEGADPAADGPPGYP